jgi:hypothetical protein
VAHFDCGVGFASVSSVVAVAEFCFVVTLLELSSRTFSHLSYDGNRREDTECNPRHYFVAAGAAAVYPTFPFEALLKRKFRLKVSRFQARRSMRARSL